MQTVVLIIHLLLALSLIGVVLLQRSEGGGLGIGGGGMGPQAGRPPLTGLAKLTWGFAGAFIITSLALTVIGASNSAETSVLDRLGAGGGAETAPAGDTPSIPLPDIQLPPAGDQPALPPAGDAPALPPAEAPAETPAEAPAEAPAPEAAPQDAATETAPEAATGTDDQTALPPVPAE
ncbi:preprotein translocase subunit SecG [Rhodobacter sp. NTK016B]|uniref:preprotein translocase subunit SecG n=1 Tax=Rhodobacter sp. NTK016B TaxID=2759676 RepID=UPI001A8C2424|nr:preprotein translocase subunit SecG [Rhodobacter sp. NTK016B]MBN8294292.1 preprotein translocase subunit SecG [Rhodobacter sp. NTK016B]